MDNDICGVAKGIVLNEDVSYVIDLLNEIRTSNSESAIIELNCYTISYRDSVYSVQSIIEPYEKCEVDFETLKAALDTFAKEDVWNKC